MRAMRFLLALIALLLTMTASVEARAFPTPKGVSVIYGPCPAYDPGFAAGCAMSDLASLASGAYGEDCQDPDGCIYMLDRKDAMGLWHERGHIWETRKLKDSDRQWFARKLGRPASEWFLKPGQRSAGELFAEAFSYCAMGYGYRGKLNVYEESVYRYNLYIEHVQQHRQICTAIRVLDLVR